MDLMTRTRLIFPDHQSCGMNVTSTRASTIAVASCSVATLLSESLPNDGERPNKPKKFCFRNAIMEVRFLGIESDFHEACMQFSTQQKWYS